VTASPLHDDLEAVGGGQHRAVPAHDVTAGHGRRERVDRVGRVGATTGGVQDALRDHEGGAVVHLLAGLEHEDHVAAQLVAAVGEQAGGAGTSTASSRREPWPSAATWRTTPPTGR